MDLTSILKLNLTSYEDVINKFLKENPSYEIYGGKAGVIIYLVELYEITEDKKILKKSELIADSIFESTSFKESTNYSFYTGKMGVAYAFHLLLCKTGNKKYEKRLISIAKESSSLIKKSNEPIIDLINGVSGVLLGLLHIYNSGVKELWLIDSIKGFTDFIISKTKITKKGGVFWDVHVLNNRSLAGFSHGSSGIGFVFYELYKLTGNGFFKSITKMSFVYEDQYYSKIKKNWLDNRRPTFCDNEHELTSFLRDENIEAFIKDKTMLAWCHGSPGIIMTRDYTGLKKSEDFHIIIENIMSNCVSINPEEKKNHSLCHGTIGNALIVLMLKEKKRKKTHSNLIEVYEKTLEYYKKNGVLIGGDYLKKEKEGLFIGELGFFYYSLKLYRYLLGSNLGSNILIPSIKNIKEDRFLSDIFSTYTKSGFFLKLMKNHYGRTISFLEKKKKKLEPFSSEQDFIKIVSSIKNKSIKDVLRFERQIKNINQSQESLAFNYLRNIIDVNFISAEKNTENIRVKVNPRIKTIKSNYLDEDLKISENLRSLTFIVVPNYKNRILIKNHFISEILDFLQEHKSVSIIDIIIYFSGSIENHSENRLIETINSLIQIGLIEVNYENF